MTLSQREKERLAAALPPFDGIDLALATHDHYDHTDGLPEVVEQVLTPLQAQRTLVRTVDTSRRSSAPT